VNICLRLGDCTKVLATLDEGSVGNIVSDPPYGLEFMGKDWDRLDSFSDLKRPDIRQPGQSNYKDSTHNPYGRSKVRYGVGKAYGASNSGQGQQAWHMEWLNEAFRVLKSGGQVKAFSGSRTFHRLAAAMSEAGFTNIRVEAWCYGSGFPKSYNIGKNIEAVVLYGGSSPKQVADARARSGQEDPTENEVRHEFDREEWAGTGSGRYRNKPGGKWSVTTEEAKPWEGWGTALKPSWEPVIVGRKP
tara:strand:- start:6055 stop:6789 length:735 start_codon:yes stop_codon:yes gene_type:complete